jgi:hypothetical protein
MRYPKHAATAPSRRLRFGLFEPHLPAPTSSAGARWLINGFPATVVIWTQEQWAALEDRPSDAQLHPTGVWCALRME